MPTAGNKMQPNDIADTSELGARTNWVSMAVSERDPRVLTKHWQWKPINEKSRPQARKERAPLRERKVPEGSDQTDESKDRRINEKSRPQARKERAP